MGYTLSHKMHSRLLYIYTLLYTNNFKKAQGLKWATVCRTKFTHVLFIHKSKRNGLHSVARNPLSFSLYTNQNTQEVKMGYTLSDEIHSRFLYALLYTQIKTHKRLKWATICRTKFTLVFSILCSIHKSKRTRG